MIYKLPRCFLPSSQSTGLSVEETNKTCCQTGYSPELALVNQLKKVDYDLQIIVYMCVGGGGGGGGGEGMEGGGAMEGGRYDTGYNFG